MDDRQELEVTPAPSVEEAPSIEAPVSPAEPSPAEENETPLAAETQQSEGSPSDEQSEPAELQQEFDAELFGHTSPDQPNEESSAESNLRAVVEAVIYVTEEPLTAEQIAAGLDLPKERILEILRQIEEECARPERGVSVREVAGGYKMGTKPEHHEAIRAFVKKLRPPFKLSLAALETLAVIAYKQPITSPEIMEVRGVQGAGVVKTLLDRKLIAPAGRKQVVGKPILYKTTKEFLLQFGLKDLLELPTLKEFEELRRLAFNDDELAASVPESPQSPTAPEPAHDSNPEPVSEPDPEPAPAEPGEDPPAPKEEPPPATE